MTEAVASPASFYVVNPSIVTEGMKNGAILMDTATGDCFELNRTGTEIWALLGKGAALGDIARDLVARYRLREEQALADVRELTQDLVRRGILKYAPR